MCEFKHLSTWKWCPTRICNVSWTHSQRTAHPTICDIWQYFGIIRTARRRSAVESKCHLTFEQQTWIILTNEQRRARTVLWTLWLKMTACYVDLDVILSMSRILEVALQIYPKNIISPWKRFGITTAHSSASCCQAGLGLKLKRQLRGNLSLTLLSILGMLLYIRRSHRSTLIYQLLHQHWGKRV